MAIFNSYVSLPEGTSSYKIFYFQIRKRLVFRLSCPKTLVSSKKAAWLGRGTCQWSLPQHNNNNNLTTTTTTTPTPTRRWWWWWFNSNNNLTTTTSTSIHQSMSPWVLISQRFRALPSTPFKWRRPKTRQTKVLPPKKVVVFTINGKFRILKWRYVSTIFLAICCADITKIAIDPNKSPLNPIKSPSNHHEIPITHHQITIKSH